MTNKTAPAEQHRFIEQSEELYQSDPLAAVKVLTNGVEVLLRSHDLTISECGNRRNGDVKRPGIPLATIPEQELEAACCSLDQMARDGAAGRAPDPDEWDLDVRIARSTIELVATVHG